jgi:hypothetical protein
MSAKSESRLRRQQAFLAQRRRARGLPPAQPPDKQLRVKRPSRPPSPAPGTGAPGNRLRWRHHALTAILLVAAIASTLFALNVARPRSRLPKPLAAMTAADLAAMPDSQLAKLDPLIMNLIVARGIPGLENLDIDKYAKTVDDWAKTINAANNAEEPSSKHDPTYRVSREFWMAGGMAVMLAGPRFGITYTRDNLTPGKPEQQFIHGVIDGKRGTCATMPVLYMAIGHRLKWPIKAVVSADHMWARWDDGIPTSKGGHRFNLEATNASSNGAAGSFSSLTDEEYVAWLQTPREAIDSGSDMTSLSPRQTLGVFLQGRAGYWTARGDLARAQGDLALAVQCFPQNRDIRAAYLSLMTQAAGRAATWNLVPTHALDPQRRYPTLDVERFNRENMEARQRLTQPPTQLNQPDWLNPVPAWPGTGPNLHLQPPR